MARIVPFRGLRPNPAIVKTVASPPYDVLDSREARDIAQNVPESFLHIIKPEIDLPEDVDPYGDVVYQRAAENLDRFIDEYILLREMAPCFYLYQQIWHDHVQTGVVACASVDEYMQGKIKKHEYTRPAKVRDRVQLMKTVQAQTGPVFLAYRQTEALAELLPMLLEKGQLVNDFVSFNDVRHRFLKIDYKPFERRLQQAFAEVPALYIADGHHRSETAAEYCNMMREQNPDHTGQESYNYFLSVIFPASDLKVLPYNRVVRDLNGHTESEFFEKLEPLFDIEILPAFREPSKTEFNLYISNQWYRLRTHTDLIPEDDPVQSLDVALLQNHVLRPLLGIDDPRTDERIDFIGGIRGHQQLEQLVNSGDYAVAFSLHPTSMQQVMDVADAGEVMPPKSTWFEPKLLSGMAVHVLD